MTACAQIISSIEASRFAEFFGQVTAIGQQSLTANGPHCRIGDICQIGSGDNIVLAQVVAVKANRVECMTFHTTDQVRVGDRVCLSTKHSSLPSGDKFQGRVIDAFGNPIDDGGPILAAHASQPKSNANLSKCIEPVRVRTGIRAIDGIIPLAKGQRIGIFAASGVGKTTLIEQLSTRIDCDKVVVCLIGERGREIQRLWALHEAKSGGPPVTMVAATSDESAISRVRAMRQSLALCEYWRERGEHVVLFVDSITRLALALREIGLAAGEPPALRSFTPNVFSSLPKFVERCGAIKGKGAITAIFSVLSETDDVDDPIVETMKSLLDGHIILSRKLAERGQYPAIDPCASISRVSDQILNEHALANAVRFKKIQAAFEDARAMIESGLYRNGTNPDIDQAIALKPALDRFLTQAANDNPDLAATDHALANALNGAGS